MKPASSARLPHSKSSKPVEKPKEIKCFPALTEDEYEKYLEFEKAQDELFELKKREQRKKQKERMLKALSEDDLAGIDVDSDEGFVQMEGLMQEKLAEKLFHEAWNGADFGKLVEDFTDDSPPGIYKMQNISKEDVANGVKPKEGYFARGGMVDAFGDVGWRLKVGELGVAPHDPVKSRYGWHIIKRLK